MKRHRLVLDTNVLVCIDDAFGPRKQRQALELYRKCCTTGRAALATNCSVLYSEDLQHGFKTNGLQIRNPFTETA